MVNLKIAGVAGIIVVVLATISFILSITMFANSFGGILGIGNDIGTNFEELGEQFNNAQKTNLIFSIIISLFTVIFLLGFITIGKMKDNKILKIVPWIFIGFIILGLIFSIVSLATWSNDPNSINLENSAEGIMGNLEGRFNENPAFAKVFAVVGLGVLIPLIILLVIAALSLQVFFATGLIQLDKKGIKLAKAAGILEIISILFGFIGHIAVILEVIIFFRLAKEQETGGQQSPPQQEYPSQQGPPRGRMPTAPREQMAPPRNLRPPTQI